MVDILLVLCSNNLFKFLVLGESGVGKTALTCRYVDGNFDDNILSTIGVDFKIKTIDQPDGKKYRIQIVCFSFFCVFFLIFELF